MRLFSTALVFVITTAFLGARTHETTHQSFDDFSKGEMNEISLHTDGYLLAAPALETLAELDAPILWDAVVDSKGNLYVGTGNQGAVFKVTPEGESETVFEPNRLMTRAIALDSRDQLYVAVSPDGTLYRVNRDGGVEIFLKLEDEYVWDMVFVS